MDPSRVQSEAFLACIGLLFKSHPARPQAKQTDDNRHHLANTRFSLMLCSCPVSYLQDLVLLSLPLPSLASVAGGPKGCQKC